MKKLALGTVFVGSALLLTACGSGEAPLTLNSNIENALHRLSPLASLNSSSLSDSSHRVISIGTYNVENFFDDVQNGDEYDDFTEAGSNWYRDHLADAKARRVAEAIELAGAPDIMGLQEFESANGKSRCLQLLKPYLDKMGYRYSALGIQHEAVSVTTAVISKFPIVKNESLDLPGDSSARDPQVATIDLNGKSLRFYVSHWKSMRGQDPATTEGERIQTANLIKSDIERARNADPSLDVILVGDLNSEYNQSQLYNMRTGIVEGLHQTGDERMMLAGRSDRMYNLWFELPENKRCGGSFNGTRRCLDNMLVTDSLFDKNGLQLVPGSFRVVGHNGGLAQEKLINADGTPLTSQEVKNKGHVEHFDAGYSDHLPIVADFVIASENNADEKIALKNPSITEFGTNHLNPDEVPVCGSHDRAIQMNEIDFNGNSSMNSCLRVNGVNLSISNLGFDAVVRVQGNQLVISMTKSFGENKDYLRTVVQRSTGKNLTSVFGKIGIEAGHLAVFANSPKDIVIRGR